MTTEQQQTENNFFNCIKAETQKANKEYIALTLKDLCNQLNIYYFDTSKVLLNKYGYKNLLK